MLQLKIGIIGDRNPEFPPHLKTEEALDNAAHVLQVNLDVRWLPTLSLERDFEATLEGFDALWCAPGSPYQSLEGALNAIQFARERDRIFIGTCGGFQHVVLEYARHVLGFEDAAHAEYDPYASRLFISPLSCSLVGQTLRIHIQEKSRSFEIYQQRDIEETYYCNFGLNPDYQSNLDRGGLRVVGVDDRQEARILELSDRQFFIATLFVPQLTSSPTQPHPLILAYLKAAAVYQSQK